MTLALFVSAYEETLDESVSTKYKSLPDSIAASDALDSFTLANAAGPRLSPATIQGSQDAKVSHDPAKTTILRPQAEAAAFSS